jgi:hypothetical protein
MLDLVKVALRITSSAFDDELNMLIDAAKLDLGIAGVTLPAELDTICKQAIITYCKIHFGDPENYDSLKASYDEQKAQLSMATGYTVWE